MIGCEKQELKTAKARKKKKKLLYHTPIQGNDTGKKLCPFSYRKFTFANLLLLSTNSNLHDAPPAVTLPRSTPQQQPKMSAPQGAISMAGIVIYRPGATNVGTPADV